MGLTAGGPQRGGRLRGLVVVAMSPVWEANHVWLPFLLVILWTAFPVFFASITSTLWIPLLLANGGIVVRGAAFVLRGYASTLAEGRVLGGMFAVSSVVVPFCLGASVGAIASDRVPVGNAAGDPIGSWLNPTSVALGLVAVAIGAHLAAVFLTADARRNGLPDLAASMRRRALRSGLVAGGLTLAALAVVHQDAPRLFSGLVSGLGLACVLGSGAAGVATLVLVHRGGYEPARYVAAASVTFVVCGWAAAQSPDLLPGLTLHDASADDATLAAVLASFSVGAVFLVPSLVLLYRLSVRGRLDKAYEPIDAPLRGRGAP